LSCLSALVLDGIISAVTQQNCPNICAKYSGETGRDRQERRWSCKWE
jgi:hypothetical protein